MKKITLLLATMLMFLTFIPGQLQASNETNPPANDLTVTIESSEAEVMIARLNEINDMDKSALTFSEKKDLRKEVRETKNALMLAGDGIYLSVGAIVLVVVLLILLL